MLKRYGRDWRGKLVKQVDIYLVQEHGIRPEKINKEARRICERLVDAGFESYIVGGAVRDLLLGIVPKDFDIATNADPKQIKRVCRRSRIIGRRFPLVHVIAFSGRVFEVATFRALNPNSENGIYGTLYEDAFRRDFTMNALYYDPRTAKVFDFHGSYDHIKQRRVVPIISPSKSFVEDPVRMLRAIKYTVITSSVLDARLCRSIRSHAKLLLICSKSRLTEEFNKVLQNERVFEILKSCFDFRLLDFWLPEFTKNLRKIAKDKVQSFWDDLYYKQRSIREPNLTKSLQFLFEDYLDRKGSLQDGDIQVCYQQLKIVILPLILPNIYIEKAAQSIFRDRGLPFTEFVSDETTDGDDYKKGSPRRRSRLQISSTVA